MTDKPTEQVSPQPSLGKDSSAKRDSNAQAVEPKGGDGCTDLQAALRKACEDAAVGCIDLLDDTAYANEYQIRKFTDIIERHLTPVFEALRDSVIEECAEIARPVDDVLAGVILKLKGAPR